ncbi:hypothetical protein GO988_10850 [Hymenobacter sp. HMF4947]|uniref:Uncharacterized protein n=1 Tax=Hymenobacter ginkgonis TaxID=2682976 RepID=A0A7K1TFA3_9BACT|nr:hypothetical protein [Hymenobacter ginkgonis]MVN76821.1 hypothetical protein [Hymenobacter ginkgonis]
MRRNTRRPLLDLDSTHPGKEEKMMQALAANPDLTTIQLTKLLYGANSASNRTALRQLRGRVQDKLLNHLFFLDHSDTRLLVSRRYELECLDLLHKVTILYLEGEYVLTEKLLRRCLRLAQQSDFTSYAEQAVRRLLTLYAEQHKRPLYLVASKQLAELRKKLAGEQEVEQILSEVNSNLARTVATRRAELIKIPAYLEKIEALHRETRTFTTFLALYRLRLAHAELVGDYKGIIRYTTQATKQLQEGKLNARRFDQRFNQFMNVYAHLRSRQPVAGLKLAEAFAQDMHPTSSNWFYFYEHYLMLALHAGEYEQALRLLHVAHKNPSFAKQRAAALERWELLEAYTEFVQPVDKLPVRRRAQLAVFAALTVPEYSRDKRGYNVAILILQLLHYLRQRLLEPVLTRLERLRKYQQRHLRDAATLRSRTFLRMLLLLPEAEFDPEVLAIRGKPLLANLQQAPLVGEAEAVAEIIPYEALWDITLLLLRQGTPE